MGVWVDVKRNKALVGHWPGTAVLKLWAQQQRIPPCGSPHDQARATSKPQGTQAAAPPTLSAQLDANTASLRC